MYRLLLSVVMIATFFIISMISSVAEPITMFLLGAGLVGVSSSIPKTRKK